MKVAVLTSVSSNIAEMAMLTIPNKAEYCLRHGYTLVARNLPYDDAVRDFEFLRALLLQFDVVWCLDADAVITDMGRRVEDLPIAPGMNVCEENIHPAVRINCGSVIWSGETALSVSLMIAVNEPTWRHRKWIWQQWVEEQLLDRPPDADDTILGFVHIHPPRTFNSCCHGDVRNWQPGDFVFHPCGEWMARRIDLIKGVLGEVRR